VALVQATSTVGPRADNGTAALRHSGTAFYLQLPEEKLPFDFKLCLNFISYLSEITKMSGEKSKEKRKRLRRVDSWDGLNEEEKERKR
jgi:hypothetical protein